MARSELQLNFYERFIAAQLGPKSKLSQRGIHKYGAAAGIASIRPLEVSPVKPNSKSYFRLVNVVVGLCWNSAMTNICHLCGTPNPEGARFCSVSGGRFKGEVDHYDGFISYRREGGAHVATLLKLLLESGFGKRFFLDVDELQVGWFDEKLLEIIANSPNFVLVLSAGSLDRCVDKSDWFKREIMHALETRRNIIPVLLDGFTFPSQQKLELLPDSMWNLPNLQAVTYSHIHRESAIRQIAEYSADSIREDRQTNPLQQSRAESDVEWLMASRAEIERLNRDAVSDTEIAIDQTTAHALPMIFRYLTDRWNDSYATIEKEELERKISSTIGLSLAPPAWNSLIRLLTVRSPAASIFRSLLFTPQKDRFAIHYPCLEALWRSPHGLALRRALGAAKELRKPAQGSETELVHWMNSLESSLGGSVHDRDAPALARV